MAETNKVKKPPVKGQIDISEAEVVVEKTNNVENETLNNYTENLKDQKTINLDEIGKKDVGESTTIDFMNEKHIENLTTQKTKRSDAPIEEEASQFAGKSVDDLKNEIKTAEQNSIKNFTVKEFEDIAKFIIFLIDTSVSSFFKWWSKDSSDTAYSLGKTKQDMLVYQLSLILVKYQAKFSIEFMFLITIVLLYAPGFMIAKKRKKEISEIKLKVVHKEMNKEININKKSADLNVVKKDESEITPTEEVPHVTQLKKPPVRKPGRVAKL